MSRWLNHCLDVLVVPGRAVWQRADRFFGYIGGIASLIVFAILEALKRERSNDPLILQTTVKQIYFTAYKSLLIVGITASLLGAVTIIQSYTLLPKVGQAGAIGKILITIFVRELGPFLTAIIIISKSGTALAADIGAMRVFREIEAYEYLGIDTIRFLVVPRMVAMQFSILFLNFYFTLVGFAIGYVIATMVVDITWSNFLSSLFQALALEDVIAFFLKTVFNGFVLSIVPIMDGFKVVKSSTEIPVAVSNAVVHSLLFVIFSNALLTVVFYL